MSGALLHLLSRARKALDEAPVDPTFIWHDGELYRKTPVYQGWYRTGHKFVKASESLDDAKTMA